MNYPLDGRHQTLRMRPRLPWSKCVYDYVQTGFFSIVAPLYFKCFPPISTRCFRVQLVVNALCLDKLYRQIDISIETYVLLAKTGFAFYPSALVSRTSAYDNSGHGPRALSPRRHNRPVGQPDRRIKT